MVIYRRTWVTISQQRVTKINVSSGRYQTLPMPEGLASIDQFTIHNLMKKHQCLLTTAKANSLTNGTLRCDTTILEETSTLECWIIGTVSKGDTKNDLHLSENLGCWNELKASLQTRLRRWGVVCKLSRIPTKLPLLPATFTVILLLHQNRFQTVEYNSPMYLPSQHSKTLKSATLPYDKAGHNEESTSTKTKIHPRTVSCAAPCCQHQRLPHRLGNVVGPYS